MANYARFVRRRLMNLGVSYGDAAATAAKFQQNVASQGEEHAVTYYKKVGDTLLNYLYGSPTRPTWVQTTRAGFPKALVHLRGYSEEILVRVAKLARVIRLQAVSPKQVAKVVQAPITPYTGADRALDSMTYFINMGVEHYYLRSSARDFRYEPDRVANYFTTTLTSNNPSPVNSRKEPPIVESLRIVAKVPVLQVTGWEKAFWPIHPECADFLIGNIPEDPSQTVGEIHAAQEGGAKLRMFASPYTIVQCLLSPIHKFVDGFRRLIPTDCTYDQLSGALWAQSKLLEGTIVHSVDLSTATCRFPLQPQLDLLRTLGVPADYIEALHWACRSDWTVGRELRVPFKRDTLAWVVGQPLGLKPSMSMFSLAHNLLLTGLAISLSVNPSDSFRVLGDDVVIADSALHEAYVTLLQLADVPISWNKCHSSNRVAEFAGATISRSSVLRPGQWRPARIESIISVADSLGTPTYGEVTALLATVQEAYLFMDGRFSPPPDKWPLYLKMASTINNFWLDHMTVCDAPLRYDKCRKVFSAAIEKARINRSPRGFTRPVAYVYECPDLAKAAFAVLRNAHQLDQLMNLVHNMEQSMQNLIGSNRKLAPVAVSQALALLEMAWDRGLLSMHEYKEIGADLIQSVHSLLYLEPPKGGPERMLRRLQGNFMRVVNTSL